MVRFARISFVFAVLATFCTSAAMAAPQVLAVLSTGHGAALACEDGVCSTSLSTYCLQQHRSSPDQGAPYHAANPTNFALVFEMPDGALKTQIAPTVLSYRAERSYKSVEVLMSADVLKERGAVSVRLLVRPNASLIPDTEIGDLDPLTDAEIALAVGPSRMMGSKIVDSMPEAKLARALGVMLRSIPEWRGWPTTSREELWKMIDKTVIQEDIDGDGRTFIKSQFDRCADSFEAKKFFGIGYCIRQRHDEEITRMNKSYWDSQAGS